MGMGSGARRRHQEAKQQNQAAMDAAERCDVVLVAGTSLAVLTGLWIVRQAMARGAALVVINRGPTAVDEVADVRVQGGTSQALAPLARALGA